MQKEISLFFLSLCFLIPWPSYAQDLSPLEKEKSFLIEDEKNTIDIFKTSSPFVVSVDSVARTSNFFSYQTHEVPAGSGTGFIWDDKGHVITNFHVIQAATMSPTKIFVTTKDGKRLQAEIIGAEPRKDIAVLKVKGLSPKHKGFAKKLADSTALQVGQKVLAIGNPFGFEQTLTTGIISALDRSMPAMNSQITIRNMIQTDASINPGNSGGPLLDSRGYLTGMNTAIISGSGSSAGIGFAVPSNTIARMAEQIIKFGHVKQPGLGIYGIEAREKMILARYGVPVDKGVIIDHVEPGSPAALAGIKGLKQHPRYGITLGDIITHVDETEVNNFDDLYNILSQKNPNDVVEVKLKRKGKTFTKKITLKILKITS